WYEEVQELLERHAGWGWKGFWQMVRDNILHPPAMEGSRPSTEMRNSRVMDVMEKYKSRREWMILQDVKRIDSIAVFVQNEYMVSSTTPGTISVISGLGLQHSSTHDQELLKRYKAYRTLKTYFPSDSCSSCRNNTAYTRAPGTWKDAKSKVIDIAASTRPLFT
ncbi:MAG: hypothetical protein TREMPRED_004516, partial [Tremellales sp. Tagirdzhanova-0007]